MAMVGVVGGIVQLDLNLLLSLAITQDRFTGVSPIVLIGPTAAAARDPPA
jgi:hypothetical protein